MELYDAMRSMPSQRFFLPEPVPLAVIHRVLDNARFASSGGNRQGWRVIVVSDVEQKRRLRDLYRGPFQAIIERSRAGQEQHRLANQSRVIEDSIFFAEHLDEVPLILVICVDINALALTDARLDRPSIVGGASIHNFMQNVLLGCRNEGLASAVTTLLAEVEPEAQRVLDLPANLAIAAMVPVGYPDPQRTVTRLSRRPVEEFAFVDRFGGEPLRPGSG